jgi:hypothetical protein
MLDSHNQAECLAHMFHLIQFSGQESRPLVWAYGEASKFKIKYPEVKLSSRNFSHRDSR